VEVVHGTWKNVIPFLMSVPCAAADLSWVEDQRIEFLTFLVVPYAFCSSSLVPHILRRGEDA
jgi:hypothetical protein